MYGGATTYIPVKVNQAGVVPVIFASSLLYVPQLAASLMIALGLAGIGSQALYSGVSLLIMVGVGLDTVKQIESQLRQHRYEGFLPRPVRPAGKVHGTSDAPAALTLS